jgi:hypothetical protein
LGLTPRLAQASLRGEPGLKSFFFPLYVNTVIWRSVELDRVGDTNDGPVNARMLVMEMHTNKIRLDMNLFLTRDTMIRTEILINTRKLKLFRTSQNLCGTERGRTKEGKEKNERV